MTTATELIEEVRKIAKSAPEFVYGKQPDTKSGLCSYFGKGVGDPTGQACIVGQAMKNLEVDTEKLQVMEDEGCGSAIWEVLDDQVIQMDYERSELDWLQSVQTKQDDDWSWEKAVAYADQHQKDMEYINVA